MPSRAPCRGHRQEVAAEPDRPDSTIAAGSTLHSASDTKGPNTASILGTAGRIDIDEVWYSPTSFRVYNSNNEVVESYDTPEFVGRGMHFQATEAERLVAAGLISSELLSTAESVQIMETLDEMRAQIGLVYPGE